MIRVGSTCSCRACRSIDSLDLKFVVHHGRYVCRSVAGTKKLVGSDVVVVHRLLKNAVSEDLGTRAYALLTDAAVVDLGLDTTAQGLVPVELAYDDVGVLSVWVRDLSPFWNHERDTERARVSPASAVVRFRTSLPAPPALVWEHLADPLKRRAWTVGSTGIEQSDPCRGAWRGQRRPLLPRKARHGRRVPGLEARPLLTRRMRGTPMGECIVTWEIQAEPAEPTRTILTVLGTAATRRGRIQMRAMALPFRRYLARSTERLAGELETADGEPNRTGRSSDGPGAGTGSAAEEAPKVSPPRRPHGSTFGGLLRDQCGHDAIPPV